MQHLGKISEQVLSGIVQSIEAAVVLHDRNLKVTFVNDSFESIFEIGAQDVIGRSPMEFLPDFDEEHKEAIITRLNTTLETGTKSHYHEFPYCSPSGKFRHLLAISIPINDQKGTITHVMSVIHNITARKELEQKAINTARLSSVADMAYTLAHEINNPLTGIKLGLGTLSENLQKEGNILIVKGVMKDLNRIQNTVHAFLKERKKAASLKKKSLSLMDDIIKDVLFHLSGQLELNHIKVTKKTCDADFDMLIDRDGIYQVLLNLLLNAIQAIRKEGEIDISTDVVTQEFGSAGSQRFVCLSVSDSGKGIDKRMCEEVFRPFYSTKQGGTGMGLSISKKIISAHKGFMEFESEKEHGSTARVFIPLLNDRV